MTRWQVSSFLGGMLNLTKMLKLVEAETMVSLEPYLAKVEAD